MQDEENMVFNSSDEALQKLADLTGKKIMIPNDEESIVGGSISDGIRSEGKEKSDAINKAYDEAANIIETEIES